MQKQTAVIFILARMEITAVLYFLRNGVKLHFYSLGTIFEENIWGVQIGGSRTGGFCGLNGTQNEGFSMSKIRLFVCSWHRKS